jgi:hypothetical protein
MGEKKIAHPSPSDNGGIVTFPLPDSSFLLLNSYFSHNLLAKAFKSTRMEGSPKKVL